LSWELVNLASVVDDRGRLTAFEVAGRRSTSGVSSS